MQSLHFPTKQLICKPPLHLHLLSLSSNRKIGLFLKSITPYKCTNLPQLPILHPIRAELLNHIAYLTHIAKSLMIASIAVRNSASRATFAGNVSHRLHIGFEDSSKSEGVVTRHCHFAESLGIAVNNCYICENSKREYAQG